MGEFEPGAPSTMKLIRPRSRIAESLDSLVHNYAGRGRDAGKLFAEIGMVTDSV